MNTFKPSVPALVAGLCIIIATIIGSFTYYRVQSLGNTLVVTGSAKQAVKADLAKWSITTSKVVDAGNMTSAYTQVSSDAASIKNFLMKNGITADQITSSPIFNDDYYTGNSVRMTNVREVITVNSNDVDRIKTISENMTVLSQQGVVFSPEAPQYSVSVLPDLRVSLMGKAVTDARARANAIAESTGQSIGKLKSASSGVVQVLQPNSNDVSDYGQYDTTTINKDVMVTVRATFLVR